MLDTKDPGFQADPYPHYARLRREAPMAWLPHPDDEPEHGGSWLFTRHADCAALLRDERATAERFPESDLREIAAQPDSPLATISRVVLAMMLTKDGNDHARLRGLVNKAFTPRVVGQLAPRIQTAVESLLAPARASGQLDVIAELAVPLPLTVISDLLGLPRDDSPRLKAWSAQLVTFLDGTVRDDLIPTARAVEEMDGYFAKLFAARRAEPRDDLITRLVEAREAEDRLSDDELLGTVVLLMAAGHETTTNLIGNGTWALLRHPDQLERLRDHPELIRGAVEELLRYDSPVQLTSRRATCDFELYGNRIRRGVELNLALGAGNRDPDEFASPDELDLGRVESRHLSFGYGAHFCLGAALARLEGQIAIQGLVQALPGMKAAAEPVYKPGIVLRGLTALHVRA